MSVSNFKSGDLVWKHGGRYGGPGRIVGITEDLGDGYRLYNVAMKVEGGYGEFVHVFPASVLEHSHCIYPPADKGHAVGKITMGCPVHAQPVEVMFNLPGEPHQDGGGDE